MVFGMGSNMNVLSLFDGMSCGRIALQRAGIPISNYFASEIDKYAIEVSQSNWNDVTAVGNVKNLRYSIDTLETEVGNFKSKIDLMIGGSPCQSFSTLGSGNGFQGKSGLFYEYVRLLKELNPKYFLLENVRMKTEWSQLITKELGVEPILFNSNLVSAQHRTRLYWTNIPFDLPTDKNICLKDVLDARSNNFVPATIKFANGVRVIQHLTDKARCLTAQSGINGVGRIFMVDPTYVLSKPFDYQRATPLTVVEHERLQTVPEGYTRVASKHQAYKMLGNGWTVDAIAHIFKGIQLSNPFKETQT